MYYLNYIHALGFEIAFIHSRTMNIVHVPMERIWKDQSIYSKNNTQNRQRLTYRVPEIWWWDDVYLQKFVYFN